MPTLLRIGYFSLISHVPVKTLRYYDEVGLLKAFHNDPNTGYRYYTSAQLPRLYRILALKDHGLTLDQIKDTLERQLTDGEFLELLVEHQRQLRSEIDQRKAQLERLEARVKQLSSPAGDRMEQYEVVLKTVKPLLVASQRFVVPQNDQVPVLLGRSYRSIRQHIEEQRGRTSGPCLTVWYTPSDQYVNEDVEAALPLAEAIPAGTDVQVRHLPAMEVASVVHQGRFDDFTDGHAHILRWAEIHGYQIGDQYREIYIAGSPSSSTSTTEIQFAVLKS